MSVNAVLNALHERGLQLVMRDGRLRVRGDVKCDDLLPALRARRSAFERRAGHSGTQRVYSALRGRYITIGDGGDYTTAELPALIGFSRNTLRLIDAVKREFTAAEILYQERTSA